MALPVHCSRLIWIEGEKLEDLEKNPLSKEENQATCDARSCIEPAPQWWETNALTTCLPPLLSPLGYLCSLLPLTCIAWMYFIPSFSLSTKTTCWFTGHTLSSSNKWRLAWSFSIFWLKRVISVWEHYDCQAGSTKICSQSCTVHWTCVPENLPQSFIVCTCM